MQIHKTVCIILHLTMERIVYEVKFQRGKVLLEDESNFLYASNGQELYTNGCWCSRRRSNAIITTWKSTWRLTNNSQLRVWIEKSFQTQLAKTRYYNIVYAKWLSSPCQKLNKIIVLMLRIFLYNLFGMYVLKWA